MDSPKSPMGYILNFKKNRYHYVINPFNTGNPETGTFTNNEGPDEMSDSVAFHQGLHC